MRCILLLTVLLPFTANAQQAAPERVGWNGSQRGGGGSSTVEVYNMGWQPLVDSLINYFMLGGCVDVTNIQYTGHPQALGLLVDTGASMGMEYGVIMTTGLATIAIGPNSVANAGVNLNFPGDSTMTAILNMITYDACIIEFDFIPAGDTIFVADFVFASEEYPEYVNSAYNDAFAFFIDGPNVDGPVNVAWVPGTQTHIAINSVNHLLNSEYYVNNTDGEQIQYDGYTTPIYLDYPVIAGETYHLRIVIVDAADAIYDSGVIIRSQSFCADSWFQSSEFVAEPQPDGMTVQFHNLSQRADDFVWDFGDGTTSTEVSPTHTYSLPDDYVVTLTSSNACFDTTTMQLVSAQMVTDIEEMMPASEWNIHGSNNSGQMRFTYNADRSANVSLSLFDMSGRLMFEKGFGRSVRISETLDLSALPQGIYVARIQAGGVVEAKRVVR
jgi:PKD repeat protein